MSQAEAVDKLHIRPARGVSALDRLADLEAARAQPTRPMLARMAKVYRRPLLTFYLSSPPRKGDRGRDFRTLPENYSVVNNTLLDVLIRDVMARQSMVRAALEDEEEAVALDFVGSAHVSAGRGPLLKSIRNTLNIDEQDLYREADPDQAFGLLRASVEATGAFVLLMGDLGSYHTAIDLEVFRGFALADPVAPFVVVNDHDSHAAWSFTLLHELAHVWLGETGVSGASAGMEIEKLCNDVAGDFLLPAHEIAKLVVTSDMPVEVTSRVIGEFASERNLSSSMVAYRLYRLGSIEVETWEELSAAFRDRWLQSRARRREKNRTREGGPDYYVIRRHRVGTPLIQLVRRMLVGGVISTSWAGKVLGVRPKNVGPLIEMGHRT